MSSFGTVGTGQYYSVPDESGIFSYSVSVGLGLVKFGTAVLGRIRYQVKFGRCQRVFTGSNRYSGWSQTDFRRSQSVFRSKSDGSLLVTGQIGQVIFGGRSKSVKSSSVSRSKLIGSLSVIGQNRSDHYRYPCQTRSGHYGWQVIN